MKKLTAVFITFLFAYTGFSQGEFRVHAGPQFNFLKSEGSAADFSKIHAGYLLGVGYEMMVSKNFSIQPEFNFSHLLSSESISSSEIKLDYIQIPVLLKGVSNNRTFSVYLGPQLGFLAKARLEQAGNSSDIRDDLTQTDFSGVLGIEYVLSMNIILSARFTQGFSNVYKAEFDSPNTTRHQIFGLLVGYKFNKKK